MALKYPISVTPTTKSRISSVDFTNIPFGKVISDHMFVAEYDGKQWVNLRIEAFHNMEMSPANLALHYGQSIFEGMKATKRNGEPVLFRADAHARRLNVSAERMCMPQLPEDLFMQALKMLVDLDRDWIPKKKATPCTFARLCLPTTRTSEYTPRKRAKFIIFTGPVGPYYPKPVRLWVEEVFTRAAQGGVGEAKCAGNYGASLLPAQRAKKAGYDQIMWMDAQEEKICTGSGYHEPVFRDGR